MREGIFYYYLCKRKNQLINKTMKKFTYLLATAALLAACSGNQGYTVKGTVEGAADGDTVYMRVLEGRQWLKVDSTVIKNGQFTFTGQQDSAVHRYITCTPAGKDGLSIDFFLENGSINVQLTAGFNDAATGTPNNDIYQGIRTKINANLQQISALLSDPALSDSTLTEEELEAKHKEASVKEEEINNSTINIVAEGIAQNITNPVGIYLLKNNYYALSVEQLAPLMPQIPAAYDNDELISRIKDNVEKLKKTAVGQKFTDFEMQTPDGKAVKLSDYVGKGKVVLVDFWASWCGPCRREMPNLVETYKKYKNKGFEIVGVSLDRDAEAWKNGIKQLNITWPQMSDLKQWDCEGAKLYAVSSIPHTVLINAEGIILARGLHGEELQEKVAEALK